MSKLETLTFYPSRDLLFWGEIARFGCIEEFENIFNIEFSCGDGLFLSDLWHDDETFSKYDGLVDLSLFRDRETKQQYSSDKYKLTCKFKDDEFSRSNQEYKQCKIVKKGRYEY